MAKVMFGGIATDARGKLAGVVYSKNASGAYVRQKVSPTQSLTTRRGLVRTRVTNLSKYWSATLSAEQVAAWNAFAKNNPVTDVFGRSQTLSGIQTFTRLNGIILNSGGSQIDDPPGSLTIDGITTMTVTATAGSPDVFSIAFGPSPLGSNLKISLFATQGLPVGRTFAKPFLRYIGSSSAAQATPYNAAAAYLAKFGAMTAGNKIGVQAKIVDITTGAQTSGLYDLVTVG